MWKLLRVVKVIFLNAVITTDLIFSDLIVNLQTGCPRKNIFAFTKGGFMSMLQAIALGLIRSDVMLGAEPEMPPSSFKQRQVEINTIAAGFGWLGPASGDLHRSAALTQLQVLLCIVCDVARYHKNDLIFLVTLSPAIAYFSD